MWWNMAPAHREEFENWHSHEHFPERISLCVQTFETWTDSGGFVERSDDDRNDGRIVPRFTRLDGCVTISAGHQSLEQHDECRQLRKQQCVNHGCQY